MKRQQWTKPGLSPTVPHEDSESWLVSYADMITLLLGLFVMLYSFSSVDEQKFAAISSDIADAFNGDQAKRPVRTNPSSTKERRALQMLSNMLSVSEKDILERIEHAAASESSKSDLQLLFQSQSVTADLLISPTSSGNGSSASLLEMVIPNNAIFATGTADLTEQSKIRLAKIADALKTIPGQFELLIEGHTDSRPVTRGVYRNNWSLSAARAGSVAQWFIQQGIDQHRIRTSGLAHLQPRFPERDRNGSYIYENLDRNRRVELKVRRGYESPTP